MRTKEMKKTVRVTITLDQDIWKRIAHLAIDAGMSKSGFLPWVVACGVGSLEKLRKGPQGAETLAETRWVMEAIRKERKSHA